MDGNASSETCLNMRDLKKRRLKAEDMRSVEFGETEQHQEILQTTNMQGNSSIETADLDKQSSWVNRDEFALIGDVLRGEENQNFADNSRGVAGRRNCFEVTSIDKNVALRKDKQQEYLKTDEPYHIAPASVKIERESEPINHVSFTGASIKTQTAIPTGVSRSVPTQRYENRVPGFMPNVCQPALVCCCCCCFICNSQRINNWNGYQYISSSIPEPGSPHTSNNHAPYFGTFHYSPICRCYCSSCAALRVAEEDHRAYYCNMIGQNQRYATNQYRRVYGSSDTYVNSVQARSSVSSNYDVDKSGSNNPGDTSNVTPQRPVSSSSTVIIRIDEQHSNEAMGDLIYERKESKLCRDSTSLEPRDQLSSNHNEALSSDVDCFKNVTISEHRGVIAGGIKLEASIESEQDGIEIDVVNVSHEDGESDKSCEACEDEEEMMRRKSLRPKSIQDCGKCHVVDEMNCLMDDYDEDGGSIEKEEEKNGSGLKESLDQDADGGGKCAGSRDQTTSTKEAWIWVPKRSVSSRAESKQECVTTTSRRIYKVHDKKRKYQKKLRSFVVKKRKKRESNSTSHTKKQRISSSRDTQGKIPKSKDTEKKGLRCEDTQSKGLKSRDTENKGLKSKDTQSEGLRSEDTQSKGLKNKDTQSKGLKNKDTENKGLKSKDTENKRLKSKDTENKRLKSKDTQSKRLRSEDTESKSQKGSDRKKPRLSRSSKKVEKWLEDNEISQHGDEGGEHGNWKNRLRCRLRSHSYELRPRRGTRDTDYDTKLKKIVDNNDGESDKNCQSSSSNDSISSAEENMDLCEDSTSDRSSPCFTACSKGSDACNASNKESELDSVERELLEHMWLGISEDFGIKKEAEEHSKDASKEGVLSSSNTSIPSYQEMITIDALLSLGRSEEAQDNTAVHGILQGFDAEIRSWVIADLTRDIEDRIRADYSIHEEKFRIFYDEALQVSLEKMNRRYHDEVKKFRREKVAEFERKGSCKIRVLRQHYRQELWMKIQVCVCGTVGQLFCCGDCRATFYCSRKCQIKDRKHNLICKKKF